jgi:PII-like signaling protein
MLNTVPGKKLVITVESTERWHGQPLYSAIVEKCRKGGVAGATVTNCVEGYGSHHVLHTTRLLSLSDDLPVRIEIVETADRLDGVLALLSGMLGKGLVVAYDVQILRESADPTGQAPPAP